MGSQLIKTIKDKSIKSARVTGDEAIVLIHQKVVQFGKWNVCKKYRE